MSNYQVIYWLTRLQYIQGFFIGVAVTCAALFVLHFIIYAMSIDGYKLLKPWQRSTLLICATLFTLLACLTPTRNEAILIAAGGKAMNYVQADTSLQKIPYQTTTIISQFLEKQIKELKEAK